MANLAEAGNTYFPAMAVLKSKGYKLRERLNERDGEFSYHAYRGGYEFSAFSTEALLGIVCIWEMYGENWQSSIRKFEFDEREIYSEDEDGNITATLEDQNGIRQISY